MCLSKLTVRPACQIHNSHTDRSVGHTTRHGLWTTFAEFGRRHWLLGITLWKEERWWVNGVCSAAVSSLHWIIQIEKTAVDSSLFSLILNPSGRWRHCIVTETWRLIWAQAFAIMFMLMLHYTDGWLKEKSFQTCYDKPCHLVILVGERFSALRESDERRELVK